MATSGSIDYTVSSTDIITEALEQCGVLAEGQAPNSDQLASSLRTLNMLTKHWQAAGLNLFAVQTLYLFPKKTQQSYIISSSTTDHVTSSFVKVLTTATASSGASSIVVDDYSNINDGDYIGIQQGTVIQWTTVNGTPVSTTISLATTLDADVAVGATVYVYTSKAFRPMRVLEAYDHNDAGNTDLELLQISRMSYNRLNNKATTGRVNQIYYDPQIVSPKVYIWPTVDNEANYIKLFVQRTLEDQDDVGNSPDYPQEWYLPLAMNLASLLTSKYGVPVQTATRIDRQAMYYYEQASDNDSEIGTSVYFEVADR